MTAARQPSFTSPSWRGDPAIFVYAVRYALGRQRSHAPQAVLQAIQSNGRDLPPNTQRVLIKDMTDWLDGPGARASRTAREPWVMALAVLGVRRSVVRAETTP